MAPIKGSHFVPVEDNTLVDTVNFYYQMNETSTANYSAITTPFYDDSNSSQDALPRAFYAVIIILAIVVWSVLVAELIEKLYEKYLQHLANKHRSKKAQHAKVSQFRVAVKVSNAVTRFRKASTIKKENDGNIQNNDDEVDETAQSNRMVTLNPTVSNGTLINNRTGSTIDPIDEVDEITHLAPVTIERHNPNAELLKRFSLPRNNGSTNRLRTENKADVPSTSNKPPAGTRTITPTSQTRDKASHQTKVRPLDKSNRTKPPQLAVHKPN